MTTLRQIEANRRNAQKSTGPRSEDGLAKSSRNAQRHGLTAPPEAQDVATWLSVILGEQNLPADAEIVADARMNTAVRLAVAEARANRRREANNRIEADNFAARIAEDADQRSVWDKAAEVLLYLAHVPGGLDALKMKARDEALAKRYLREAEGSLRLARKAWIAAERERRATLTTADNEGISDLALLPRRLHK